MTMRCVLVTRSLRKMPLWQYYSTFLIQHLRALGKVGAGCSLANGAETRYR